MSKDNPFRKAIASRQSTEFNEFESIAEETIPEKPVLSQKTIPAEVSASIDVRKRGRPATGKRSDDAWIGRTFYIQQETDFDTAEELLKLKRQGIELDKSELVDKLLSAWVKWRKGENLDLHLAEISPIQNSKNTQA
jgi:hypothetical protein